MRGEGEVVKWSGGRDWRGSPGRGSRPVGLDWAGVQIYVLLFSIILLGLVPPPENRDNILNGQMKF